MTRLDPKSSLDLADHSFYIVFRKSANRRARCRMPNRSAHSTRLGLFLSDCLMIECSVWKKPDWEKDTGSLDLRWGLARRRTIEHTTCAPGWSVTASSDGMSSMRWCVVRSTPHHYEEARVFVRRYEPGGLTTIPCCRHHTPHHPQMNGSHRLFFGLGLVLFHPRQYAYLYRWPPDRWLPASIDRSIDRLPDSSGLIAPQSPRYEKNKTIRWTHQKEHDVFLYWSAPTLLRWSRLFVCP